MSLKFHYTLYTIISNSMKSAKMKDADLTGHLLAQSLPEFRIIPLSVSLISSLLSMAVILSLCS